MKLCKKCNLHKELTEFSPNPSRENPERLRSQCKLCDKEVQKGYYKSNKKRINEKTLAYQRKNPEKRKGYKLKLQYSTTLSEYRRLFELQGGKCAICGSDNSGCKTKRSLCVDHDHATGKIRGLLCDNCNKGLGCFKDSLESLNLAGKYLKNAGEQKIVSPLFWVFIGPQDFKKLETLPRMWVLRKEKGEEK